MTCQRLKTLKLKAARRQDWCCYYCRMPMWDDDLDQFVIRYRLTRRLAQTLKCTAEHLTAQCEGGKDRADNIVAACLICNRRRHQTMKPKSPSDYQRHVQGRVRKGKWHPQGRIKAVFNAGGEWQENRP
ncbi:HNH endonuclease [Asticcacaulis taihuensis]|uniref:HNH endonuclease n=1 Tax=Asticcacaulis taihuensis TaxID=260084 RepID=UPI003F6931F2